MAQAHHSDVIGSLLRPRYLTEARDAYAGGQLDAPAFKRIEDRAVDEAIEMQENIGLDVITDGEFRRFSFLDQIVSEIDGVAPIEGAPVHFKSATEDWIWHNPFTVTGKISQRRKLTIEEFAYNRARASTRIKITLPTPPRSSGPRPRRWPRSAAPISRSTRPTSAPSSTRRTGNCARAWAYPPSGP